MKNLIFPGGILLLMILACSHGDRQSRYADEVVVDVIVDLHIASGMLERAHTELRDSLTTVYNRQIYSIHDVDEASFRTYLEDLKKDPEHYESIYEEVVKKLEELRDEF